MYDLPKARSSVVRLSATPETVRKLRATSRKRDTLMHIKGRVRSTLLALLLTLGIGATAVAATTQPAAAASTTCRTLTVSGPGVSFTPRMYVPVCYNGSTVWMNGGITPANTTIGWAANVTWYGWYNDASWHWLGVGENVNLTMGALGVTVVSITCAPRWYINPSGVVYHYDAGC